MSDTAPERAEPKPAGPSEAGWICVPLRLALGGIFVFAAYNKLFTHDGPQRFSYAIKGFQIPMPDWLMVFSTFAVPWVELFAAIALILGLWTRAAAMVIGAMLVVFIGMYGSILARGMSVECGCFGKLAPFCPKLVGMCHIVQNGVMLAAAVIILLTARHALAISRPALGSRA